MEEEFWQSRWRENRIAFHEARPNALLQRYFERLALSPGDTVFVPLSGKSVDLDWLRDQGLRVVGVEFNRSAVEEVFERQGLIPEIESVGGTTRYKADAIEIYVGDFFDLSADALGPVDAVYDRAALVALPPPTRKQYAAHLAVIARHARRLLITYDYDQSQMDGPPFSVPANEVAALHDDRYSIELLSSRDISGPLSERCRGTENAWLLLPR